MISKKTMFCSEKSEMVEALAETVKGKVAAVGCSNMVSCEATRFCRFVNPLTTRNPLSENEPLPAEA